MGIIRSEVQAVIRSKWKIVLLFVLPVTISAYFGLLFRQGSVQHIRTVVVDQDGSALSRRLVQEFSENQSFKVVGRAATVQEAVNLIDAEQADFALVVPAAFSSSVKQTKPAKVGLLADAGNMAISSTALKKASQIILTFNGGVAIQVLEGKGFPETAATKLANPVEIHSVELGNPSGSYGDFLLWGLVGAVAHFPIILLAAVSLNGSGHRPSPGLVAGKIAAYSLLGCAEMLLSLAVAFLIYPLTFKGSLWALLLIAALFVLAIVSLGLMLSAALPSQVTASQAAIVVALPALILSGYTWPLSQIPWSIRILGEIEPLTYFVNPLRELALSGAVTPLYRQGAAVLGAMAVAFYLLTCLIIFGKKGCSWKKAPLAN
ncbi:ABC transporter permease [Zhaonella formicivorans]|uniref:ABC transporter permease n=1 Tax=Zhaonella formicivorans TaxID=2528593 RepID=UPI0010D864D8|nr:ABC transporter permease [Zhaonella formicivorans]